MKKVYALSLGLLLISNASFATFAQQNGNHAMKPVDTPKQSVHVSSPLVNNFFAMYVAIGKGSCDSTYSNAKTCIPVNNNTADVVNVVFSTYGGSAKVPAGESAFFIDETFKIDSVPVTVKRDPSNEPLFSGEAINKAGISCKDGLCSVNS
ncbi:MAG: hypothetical protein ACPGUD_06280 [Parashewanella sp.]